MLRHTKELAQVLPSITSYLQALRKVLPGTSLYYKVCTKYILPSSNSYYKHCTKFFPVLLCATKEPPSTALHNKVCTEHFPILLCAKSLRKTLPNTTSYYKVCTSTALFEMLRHTKELAQVLPSITSSYKHCASTSRHFFVLQGLHKVYTSQFQFVLQTLHKVRLSSTTLYYKRSHKVLPSTTLYWKIIQNHLPVLLCTTSLAQRTSQYYFVLQSLHRVLPYLKYAWTCLKQTWKLPRTTKPCTSTSQYYFVLQALRKKYFPAPLDTTSLAQSTYFPVLLRTTSIAQSSTWYYKNTSQYFFALQSECHEVPMTFLNFETSRLVAIFVGTAPRLPHEIKSRNFTTSHFTKSDACYAKWHLSHVQNITLCIKAGHSGNKISEWNTQRAANKALPQDPLIPRKQGNAGARGPWRNEH